MSIIGIVATDRHRAIGKDGKLPWHFTSDMKFFKETTTGHACVMGRNTWLTLKKPLSNRLNIVLSRHSEIAPVQSVIVIRDLESALCLYPYLKCDLFVMGGAKTYRAFLPYIEKWIVTEVPLTVEGPDTVMPANYLGGFRSVDEKPLAEGLTVRFYEKGTGSMRALFRDPENHLGSPS